MHSMTKGTFGIFLDTATNLRYVKKIQDELQKNHKECDGEIIIGFMPEIKGDPKCPVQSFEMYTNLLNARCDKLWQRPLAKENAEGNCYSRQPMGHNTLGTFISKLSEQCASSQRYTNHDIHVTSCTILYCCRFSNKEIMALTRHKSVNSLAIYQKVDFDQKICMGQTFNLALTNPKELQKQNPTLPESEELKRAQELMELLSTDDTNAPLPLALPDAVPTDNPNKENQQLMPIPQQSNNVTAAEVPNFDIMDFLNDLDDDDFNTVAQGNAQGNQMVPTAKSNVALKQNNMVVNNAQQMPQMPTFNNCKIGAININIMKNWTWKRW